MTQCTEAFDRIAIPLGEFSCRDAPAVLHLRDPLGLAGPTLPIIELMMVFGAVLALWWSIRRLRRDGDPVNLVLWCATVVYLFVIEIPLYFPNVFGIQDFLGVVFVHNAFTVQFLFDRLPLYIVALYPALITLSYEIVRVLGVFRRRHGAVVGAACVGVVHHVFYEIFDQLGPQLRWWAWDTENPMNRPMFASVPLTSVVIFAALGPFVVTLLTQFLVARRVADRPLGGAALWGWTVLIGALVPVGLAVLGAPFSALSALGPDNVRAQAVVLTAELVVLAAIAVPALVTQYRRGQPVDDAEPNAFLRIFGPVYLLTLGALWLVALPAYFGAQNGITADGTPTGSLAYAALCFVAGAVVLAAALKVRAGAAPLRDFGTRVELG
ncbi:hypothetical protein MCHIJ_19520 [Mycolicibacterium chitae]|uniref:DUF7802 domain-containing protein n=1 Tax=Mycolicibacterium chitae TaxID=1792 RepID=A0A448HYF8_MYCCI|nr:hypothetical protein [Mycolicibacterium chitae]MCV7109009.1 hypothetical protein [Mycolicibacterium chitae]BBZ02515.1 hypothetical protein MCHIJ_19520 [Mycolicibacterium chitae]VEG45154.1 Uncharacterised protein [Mycolicibacterium chitae]